MEIRTLRADEINVRLQQIVYADKKNKTGCKGAIYLLYKDARCDMAILDESFGSMNWKKEYKRDNQNCVVSIWDKEKQQWVSKEDTGTESNTEAEKGLASDSFKRACFNWGIGRELYTAPFTYIKGENDKELMNLKLSVANIQYENKVIISLVLVDEYGNVRFNWSKEVEDAKKTIGQQNYNKGMNTPKEQKSSSQANTSGKMSNDDLILLIKGINHELTTKYGIDTNGKNFIEKLTQNGITETNTSLLDNTQLTKYCDVLVGFKNKVEANANSKRAN